MSQSNSEVRAMSFILCCIPTPQQRPRHMRTKTGIDLTYKSGRQKGNEATLDALLAPHVPQTPLDGGIELQFTAIMPMPTSVSKKRKEAMLRGEIGHTVKPDLDNLAKQIKDCMTRLRFWQDDRQVVRLVCEKRYGENPAWHVRVATVCEARQG